MFPLIDVSAKNSSVVISEIQITGGSGHSNDDFIELFNNSDEAVNLNNWKIQKKIKSGTESTIYRFEVASDEKIILPAHKNLLWINNKTTDALLQNINTPFSDSFILADDYSLALFDDHDQLVDSLTYGAGHASPYSPTISFPTNPLAKTSLERDLEDNIFVLQSNPSPKNDARIEKIITKKDDADTDSFKEKSSADLTIRLNEIFPDPKEKNDASEFIELFNFGTDAIDISGFVLRDASKTGKYILPTGSSISSGGYFLLKKASSKLSLNNSEESVSLFDAQENLLDTVSYEKSREETSFSFDGNSFRWTKHLTPEEANEFDALPKIKTDIPKKAYKNMPANFSAQGSSDHKFTWDFGDDSRSYQQDATHTYKKKGKFKGSLTIDTGLEEIKKYFTIEVKKFPASSVSIIEIFPNPEGADIESEYLLLKNTGRKKINLSGWSIASGTQQKKLINHPIREKFILKKDESKKLTAAFSSFTLPNQSGFIELRQPDGKVAQKIAYQKSSGIDENETYLLQTDNQWSWKNSFQASTEKATSLETESEVDEKIVPEKNIQLKDLAPEQLSLLEAEVEKRLREKILAEVKAELSASPDQELSTDTTIDSPINVISTDTDSPETSEAELSFFEKIKQGKLTDILFSTANAHINQLMNHS